MKIEEIKAKRADFWEQRRHEIPLKEIDWLIARIEELEEKMKGMRPGRLIGPFKCAECPSELKNIPELREHHIKEHGMKDYWREEE
jgi:hypothetical protein